NSSSFVGPSSAARPPCVRSTGSEVVGGPEADPIDPRRRGARLVAVLGNVVELQLHVRVQVPVQADRLVLERPSLGGLVVQIRVTEAYADLPGARGTMRIAFLEQVSGDIEDSVPESSMSPEACFSSYRPSCSRALRTGALEI